MSWSYTSASDRDSQRAAHRSARLHTGHLLLALTSVVAMLVLGLAYAGRLSSFGWGSGTCFISLTCQTPNLQQTANLTNLNTVSDSKELEPLLERVFANAADRRFAAKGLFEFILGTRRAGDILPNVGAIL